MRVKKELDDEPGSRAPIVRAAAADNSTNFFCRTCPAPTSGSERMFFEIVIVRHADRL